MKLWIARDIDGELTIFEECPKRSDVGVWYPVDEQSFCKILPIRWFPEVTFENSPKQVEINLVKNETV